MSLPDKWVDLPYLIKENIVRNYDIYLEYDPYEGSRAEAEDVLLNNTNFSDYDSNNRAVQAFYQGLKAGDGLKNLVFQVIKSTESHLKNLRKFEREMNS